MDGLATSPPTSQEITYIEDLMSSSSISFNGENDDTKSSVTFVDLEALNCPICCDALTTPIFHCDNGHIVCSTCCNKLNKCPSCTLPVGHIRCRAMERVVKSILVPCPNAEFGCTKSFSYGKELTHEKECTFSLCSCPADDCDYTGSYINLYSHFRVHRSEGRYNYRFRFDEFAEIYFELTKYTSVVMRECKYRLLFVVQCFCKPYGIFVSVRCIGPSAKEDGEFFCHISTLEKYTTMTIEFLKVKRVRELSLGTPEEDFILVPSYLLNRCQEMKLRIRMCKLNQD